MSTGSCNNCDIEFLDCLTPRFDVERFGMLLAGSIKHADVLLAQMVKFSAALQGQFAGAIGWDAVNIFFAPFLVGMSEKDIKQIAQMMIYEYSQQAVARGYPGAPDEQQQPDREESRVRQRQPQPHSRAAPHSSDSRRQ